MDMTDTIFLTTLALGSGLCSAFIIKFFLLPLASHYSFCDHPNTPLKQHTQATPYLGGVAIFTAFCALFTLLFHQSLVTFLPILASFALLLLIGLIDDLKPMTPLIKFLLLLIPVFILIWHGYLFHYIPCIGSVIDHPYILSCISAFWLLTLINGCNLVDIMDGLLSIIAISACIVIAWCAWLYTCFTTMNMAIILAGCLSGFLWFNKPVARMYLGDAGSLMIGGMLGTFIMSIPWEGFIHHGFIIGSAIVAVPLLEVATLIIIRSYLHIPFYQGSPHHFALLLKQRKWSIHTIWLWVLGCYSFVTMVIMMYLYDYINLLAVITGGFVFILLWLFIVFKHSKLPSHTF
jgi:UDP-GlcNAc:undecaprenyl-phosphate GlcNAc-1-phosphate transferase